MLAPAVLVHGRGDVDDVLRILHDIAEKSARAAPNFDDSPISRKFSSLAEFEALVRRVQGNKAQVVLRKLFLYHGDCNVEQEIWIHDPHNPEARTNPFKSYSVIHVHHHARVANVADIAPEHLYAIDAINARHLAPHGARYQGDNPFFHTFIEPSGGTLKVFPSVADWTCKVCGQSNYQTKHSCRGRAGARCTGARPCTGWRWKEDKARDAGLAAILEGAEAALQWPSGSGKSMHRGAGGPGGQGDTFMLQMQDLMQQYVAGRGLRRDLPTADHRASAGPASEPCAACKQSPCTQGCSAWGDLHAAVLCIGVDKYTHMSELPNALRDARALCDKVNELPGCKAELVENPRDMKTMRSRIGQFLNRDGMRQRPPKLVVIIYSGHGTQPDINFYLLPADADPGDRYGQPDKDFLPLSQLFWLCKQLDDNARRLVPSKDINFGFLMDNCRVGSDGQVPRNSDPKSSEAPVLWWMCLSCSRELEAMDGAAGSHSPFASALLDPATGIFVPGMPLKKALEATCQSLAKIAGSAGQAPVSVGLHSLAEDYCFCQPVRGQEGAKASSRSASDDECCELVRFLRSEGLGMIAEQFSKAMGMLWTEHLMRLKEEDLDDPDLGFLKKWQKRELLRLVTEGVIRSASLRQGSKSDSEASTPSAGSGSTPGGGGGRSQSSATETVCLYNGGSCRDLVEHTIRLLREFQDLYTFVTAFGDDVTTEFNSPPVHWTMCMVIWCAFMTNARFDSNACVRRWQQLCSQQPREAALLEAMDDIVLQGSVKSHPQLPVVQQKADKCKRRKGVAAVAVIDFTVQECLAADQDKLAEWEGRVIAGWYESEEESSAVLQRANEFMQDSIMSIRVPVGAAVDTASYGMLLLMSALASLLFFTHLQLRKQGWLRPRAPPYASMAAATTAASSPSICPHGFVLAISSGGRSFSLTAGDAPPSAAMAVVVQGLRCLARLASSTWGMLGRVETAGELCR